MYPTIHCEVVPLRSLGQSGCLNGLAFSKASSFSSSSLILDITGNWLMSTLNLSRENKNQATGIPKSIEVNINFELSNRLIYKITVNDTSIIFDKILKVSIFGELEWISQTV